MRNDVGIILHFLSQIGIPNPPILSLGITKTNSIVDLLVTISTIFATYSSLQIKTGSTQNESISKYVGVTPQVRRRDPTPSPLHQLIYVT